MRCGVGEAKVDLRDVEKFKWTRLQISEWGVWRKRIDNEGSRTFDSSSRTEEISEGKGRFWRTEHLIFFYSYSYILVGLFSESILGHLFWPAPVKLWGQHMYDLDYFGISRVCSYSTFTILYSLYVYPFIIYVHLTLIEILIYAKNSAWRHQLNHDNYCPVNQSKTK